MPQADVAAHQHELAGGPGVWPRTDWRGTGWRSCSSVMWGWYVGDVNQTKLGKYVEDLEVKEGKEIRYVHMPSDEFAYRQEVNDRFLLTLMSSKKQVLIDKNNALTPVKEEVKT